MEEDARNWARAFGRDARSCFTQNHTHDCTDTCVKYAAKRGNAAGAPEPGEGEAAKTKASSWTVPPCRFLFYYIIVFTFLEGIHEMVRRVLRRGGALVSEAYIAAGSEHSEHGSFVPERRHPFRSSSSDVRQVVFRSNGDVQIDDWAVPTDVAAHSSGATEPAVLVQSRAAQVGSSSGRASFRRQKSGDALLRGGLESVQRGRLLHDRFQSKAQQLLSAAMGPITAGLRRFEAEAQAQAEAEVAPCEQKSLVLCLRVDHLCSHRWALRANAPEQRDNAGSGASSHARVPKSSGWRDKSDGANAAFVHRSGRLTPALPAATEAGSEARELTSQENAGLEAGRQLACKQCPAAELNVDQKRAVALVAQPMQAAWEHAR